jgi:hypothetical protein
MDGVNIGSSLAATLNANKPGLFQLANEFSDARAAHAHVLGKPFLTWEARVVVPGVAEEHGINDLGANRQTTVTKDKIRDLRKASSCDWICGVEQDVVLFDDLANWFHGVIQLSHRSRQDS